MRNSVNEDDPGAVLEYGVRRWMRWAALALFAFPILYVIARSSSAWADAGRAVKVAFGFARAPETVGRVRVEVVISNAPSCSGRRPSARG